MKDLRMSSYLIIGGTSGLGLDLARSLVDTAHSVIVTGRRDIKEQGIHVRHFELGQTEKLYSQIEEFVNVLPHIDTLIYAAGFLQLGLVTDLSERDIEKMMNVGLISPIYFVQQVLKKQGKLTEFVAITSTSQWTPRLLEPVYTAVKAGLGAFSNSLSLDERVTKTLVAAPAGMDTNFWPEQDKRDPSIMLDSGWVAKAINELRQDSYKYRFARILREPARVEIVETR